MQESARARPIARFFEVEFVFLAICLEQDSNHKYCNYTYIRNNMLTF